MFQIPPFERLLNICGEDAVPALKIYDEFLDQIGREEIRDALEKTDEKNRKQSRVFKVLREKSHDFNDKIIELLRSKYPEKHPIHYSLLF
jgi:hypothetical protein